MMGINCYTCAYGNPVYDRNGLITGVECSCENMRFLPDMHIKLFSHECTKWQEKDENERI